MVKDVVQLLKEVPALSILDDDQIEAFLKLGEIRELQQEEYIFKEGQETSEMFIILEGEIELQFKAANLGPSSLTFTKGAISGVLPYSRMKVAAGNGIARQPSIIFAMHRNRHIEIEKISFPLMQNLVGMLTDRVRENTRMQQQSEKLVALGKLSAGLAHEMNNPAAAIVRSSSELKKHLTAVPEKFKNVISVRLEPSQVDKLNDMLFSRLQTASSLNLTLSERSAMEEEMIDWMDEQGIEEGYLMAITFVETGITIDDLHLLKSEVRAIDMSSVLQWIDSVINTEKLVSEIENAAHRISELVSAVKTYSHMDKGGGKEKTDLRIGIKSTLTMLNHKLKEKKVKVVLDFEADLPKATACVSELNQVWTNLIDNAIDAVEKGGEIRIAARHEREFVAVDITDNGSGIPADMLSKIFDPFFTTKEVGKGTGLGLDIARKIMLAHNGEIKVQSQPGKTTFCLCFPIDN